MLSLLKKSVILLGIGFLFFFNIFVLHKALIGIALLVIYFSWFSRLAQAILIKFFGLENDFITRILGGFLVFSTLGFLGGIASFFFYLSPLVIAGIFCLNGFLFFGLDYWSQSSSDNVSLEADENDVFLGAPSALGGLAVFFILIGYGFYLLKISQADSGLSSPWQVIDPAYLWVFLGATLVLGLLIKSRLTVKTILLLMIVYGFLAHSYLPFTHQLFYGADQWRHLATESRLASGLSPDITVASDAARPLFLTTAPGNIFYSNFWAISVIISQSLHLDLIILTKWFLPIVWSLVFPLLIYQIGLALGLKKKESLGLVWLSILPFALQFGGAVSVPNNLGALIWLMSLLLLFKTAANPKREQVVILIIFGLLSVFGYGLYTLLFWLGTLVLFIVYRLSFISKKLNNRLRTGNLKYQISKILLILLVAFSVPTIELIVKYSQWPATVWWFAAIKQFIGNIFGWYLASGPRPHDITTGNIIFNQIPANIFVPNFITAHLWVILFFSIIIIGLTVVGWWQCFNSSSITRQWLAVMSLGLFGAYFIGRYILTGENIISRRLDIVLALVVIILLTIGSFWIINWLPNKFKFIKTNQVIIVLIILFSLAITASYSLGPDLQAIDVDSYHAAQYVWSQQPKCVLADTYPLLVVEYLSQKNLIGGGFPMGLYFAQPERVALYNEMKNNPSADVWIKTKTITQSTECYFVAKTKEINYNDYTYKNGSNWKIFGDVIVWKSE